MVRLFVLEFCVSEMIPPWRKKKYTNLQLCGFLRVFRASAMMV
jgi:hypothetical protein